MRLPPRRWPALALLLCLPMLATGQGIPEAPAERARNEQETEQRLEALRRDVAALKDRMTAGQRAESQAVAAIADAERAVSDQRRALAEIGERSDELVAELERLGERQLHVHGELDGQRQALAALLRLSYARGRQAPAKGLLDPGRTPRLARTLGYGRILQQSRLQAIRGHADSLAELVRLADARTLALEHLDQERQAAQMRTQALDEAIAERERALAALRAELASDQERLLALAQDEQAMVRLLEQLRDIFADLPDTLEGAQPFRNLRGRLPWPVAEATDVRPAGTGSGSGLRIGARAGAPVLAVAHGRVAFADWLRGYGLLAIIDHGDGYMSLYGHNQALLRQEGAWVGAGEPIAEVGDSGGQANPGLHFELRERGRGIDPRPWLRRR